MSCMNSLISIISFFLFRKKKLDFFFADIWVRFFVITIVGWLVIIYNFSVKSAIFHPFTHPELLFFFLRWLEALKPETSEPENVVAWNKNMVAKKNVVAEKKMMARKNDIKFVWSQLLFSLCTPKKKVCILLLFFSNTQNRRCAAYHLYFRLQYQQKCPKILKMNYKWTLHTFLWVFWVILADFIFFEYFFFLKVNFRFYRQTLI